MSTAAAIQQIDAARQQAEDDLRRALSVIPESDEIDPYLPAFALFTRALLDAEAKALLWVHSDAAGYERVLEAEVIPAIVNALFPHQGLARIASTWTNETRFAAEHVKHKLEDDIVLERVPAAGLLFEPAKKDINAVYGQIGYWERFAPECVQMALRWPRNSDKAEIFFEQHLQRVVPYWVETWHSSRNAATRLKTIDVGVEASTVVEPRLLSPAADKSQQAGEAGTGAPRKRGPQTKPSSLEEQRGVAADSKPPAKVPSRDWGEVTITFFPDRETVHVKHGDQAKNLSYIDLGFADGRRAKTNVKTKSWDELLELAGSQGTGKGHRSSAFYRLMINKRRTSKYRSEEEVEQALHLEQEAIGKHRADTQKRIETINKRLVSYFSSNWNVPFEGNPIEYDEAHGYQAKFTVVLSPGFKSS